MVWLHTGGKAYDHDFCLAEPRTRFTLVPTSGTWKSHCRARAAPLLHSALQSKAKPVCNWKALW